jgi:hypothetical protein
MIQQELRKSLRSDEPPEHLSLALAGLWWDAKGDWARAHQSAQQDEGPSGAWVHAYLHRKEGPYNHRSVMGRKAARATEIRPAA